KPRARLAELPAATGEYYWYDEESGEYATITSEMESDLPAEGETDPADNGTDPADASTDPADGSVPVEEGEAVVTAFDTADVSAVG
ncbi:MAG: hypothetical protein LUH45_00475, partial [Clostridiales bacterium]|nr:hypothetical protein [Clostridiales bacterium]